MDYLARCKVENIEKIINENDDFSDGDLCLTIHCTKCYANFDLSRESVAWAVLGGATFWEYVQYVQHSKCPKCNVKNDSQDH